ncbi:MAG: MBL fold metallo-hydrolase [Deltaproteobacteria bacterium]|nr:MBL fold metallo-hydrolase [Deltaproteobacteria bacterium]
MKIRFWGTRGSIAKAGQSTLRYGGNTSCVEVRSAAGDLIILDAGTGLHGLAQSLLREPTAPRSGSLLISHTHWDHIQGIPFFAPFYQPGQRWSIFGPSGVHKSLDELLHGQMSQDYFPVAMEDFNAHVETCDLKEGHFSVGDISVTTQYLNHPGVTIGYRIVVDGKTLVYPRHSPTADASPAAAAPRRPAAKTPATATSWPGPTSSSTTHSTPLKSTTSAWAGATAPWSTSPTSPSTPTCAA